MACILISPQRSVARMLAERESWIFHDRPEAPDEPSRRLIANPYGFAEWFKKRTPPG